MQCTRGGKCNGQKKTRPELVRWKREVNWIDKTQQVCWRQKKSGSFRPPQKTSLFLLFLTLRLDPSTAAATVAHTIPSRDPTWIEESVSKEKKRVQKKSSDHDNVASRTERDTQPVLEAGFESVWKFSSAQNCNFLMSKEMKNMSGVFFSTSSLCLLSFVLLYHRHRRNFALHFSIFFFFVYVSSLLRSDGECRRVEAAEKKTYENPFWSCLFSSSVCLSSSACVTRRDFFFFPFPSSLCCARLVSRERKKTAMQKEMANQKSLVLVMVQRGATKKLSSYPTFVFFCSLFLYFFICTFACSVVSLRETWNLEKFRLHSSPSFSFMREHANFSAIVVMCMFYGGKKAKVQFCTSLKSSTAAATLTSSCCSQFNEILWNPNVPNCSSSPTLCTLHTLHSMHFGQFHEMHTHTHNSLLFYKTFHQSSKDLKKLRRRKNQFLSTSFPSEG